MTSPKNRFDVPLEVGHAIPLSLEGTYPFSNILRFSLAVLLLAVARSF
jgi:hypothetical protein